MLRVHEREPITTKQENLTNRFPRSQGTEECPNVTHQRHQWSGDQTLEVNCTDHFRRHPLMQLGIHGALMLEQA